MTIRDAKTLAVGSTVHHATKLYSLSAMHSPVILES